MFDVLLLLIKMIKLYLTLFIFFILSPRFDLLMAEYKVEVTTGNLEKAGTDDHVYVTLFGINGQSERKELDNFGRDFKTGGVSQKHLLRIYIYRIFIH